MKLSELDRLQLENINLKTKILNDTAEKLNEEFTRLQQQSDDILKNFCEANNIDIKKTVINIQTGEVTVKE